MFMLYIYAMENTEDWNTVIFLPSIWRDTYCHVQKEKQKNEKNKFLDISKHWIGRYLYSLMLPFNLFLLQLNLRLSLSLQSALLFRLSCFLLKQDFHTNTLFCHLFSDIFAERDKAGSFDTLVPIMT